MKDIRRKVRRTQTISPFGVGGIIDLRGESFVAADIRSWGKNAEEVEAPRLARKLGVRGFRAAPAIPSGKSEFAWRSGPGYTRFPRWLFCPKCRNMNYWRPESEQKDKAPKCTQCPGMPQLAPMRFIQVCRNGHMSDIDWRRWAHSRPDSHERRQCQVKRLKFIATSDSSGLDALLIQCSTCGSRRNLEGISQKHALKQIGVRCSGGQPWQSGDGESEDCEETPRAVQRGASNVYFPLVHSAIDIPAPEDSDLDLSTAHEVISHDLWNDLISADGGPMEELIIRLLARKCRVTEEFVSNLYEQHRTAGTTTPQYNGSGEDLSVDEWAAFTSPEHNISTKAFSVRRIQLGINEDFPNSIQRLSQRIDSVIVADRVREVRALEGFSRYEPDSGEHLVSVASPKGVKWLPAVESYGEGIFLSIDEDRIQNWEHDSAVRGWTGKIERNLEASFQVDRLREKTGPVLLPRFVMLHTLAHQLIRQLAYDSGYNAASLRERVYAKSHPVGSPYPPQAGIFIYTAAGDAEGTLGGLVRQGQPENLMDTIVRLLESSQWCSQDPLCADSTGRSLANLNRAACHACTLLPETCCEVGNTLLDRTLLIGEGEVEGFFKSVIQAALGESASAVDAL